MIKGVVLGVVIGAAAASVVLVPRLFFERREHFERGRVDGRFAAIYAVEKEFGFYHDYDPYPWKKRVFSVKCADALLVEINGVKTIRITRPGK